jgi:hypothetical protein
MKKNRRKKKANNKSFGLPKEKKKKKRETGEIGQARQTKQLQRYHH